MNTHENKPGWSFTGKDGSFAMNNPHRTSCLYFPLANEAGMMSSITPSLNGDIKTGLNTFFMTPVSSEDLHNTRSSRNFWVYIEGMGAWSAAGNSPLQTVQNLTDDAFEDVNVECGFLWHTITRSSKKTGLEFKITNFVPDTQDRVELMKVKITNAGKEVVKLTPTAAWPVYGRSADNIRDHRHLTSLLHRVYTVPYGIEVQPVMSFDERGHKQNKTAYCVYGAEEDGSRPEGSFPLVEEYIGEGGSFEWPEAVVKNFKSCHRAGERLEGCEAIGALRFREMELQPGQSRSYIITAAIVYEGINAEYIADKYCSLKSFNKYFEDNQKYWNGVLGKLTFNTDDESFNLWLRWVTLQPVLRRIYGCSFMPHHDYGRGGRGWRDLWQDCLALLIMDPSGVRDILFNNYAGVRIDGSNATIIGSKPGEFLADRNNIPRTWMDHGTWPFFTTKLYIDQTGDTGILFEEQTYFKDGLVKRANERDLIWNSDYGNKLKTEEGSIHKGTVLEHMLLQNLVSFYNAGEHNNIKLEDADWNDGLDMAPEGGESVAFTAFYANNLMELSRLLMVIKKKNNLQKIEVTAEIMTLFDTLQCGIDYSSVKAKRELLETYYNSCLHTVSGKKVQADITELSQDLKGKAEWIFKHIRENEWIRNSEGFEWFNGYYNNDGERVEGDSLSGVRMTLTGQVFTVMGETADKEHVKKVASSVNRYLKDPDSGGYRLNTNFGGIQMNFGRCFGFAYGHKENGSMFSHMAVMYSYALYKKGFVNEGYHVIKSIYHLSVDFENSRIYPGIPEYINENKRGMYCYLTGSASWMLLTMLTQVFGIRGELGDLVLEPKLLKEQFNKYGEAGVHTVFADRKLHIVYRNLEFRNFGEYVIEGMAIDGIDTPCKSGGHIVIQRNSIISLDSEREHCILITLV